MADDSWQAIYEAVPSIACQGKCHDACGPIDASQVERDLLRERGFEIDPALQLRLVAGSEPEIVMCPVLSPFGRCMAYDVRPLICRLWGVAEGMECHYGCRPERYLTLDEARDLINRSVQLGGLPKMVGGT